MKNWLYATIGLSLLFNLIFHDKAHSYKRKSEEDPRLREHFDSQRISWERSIAGSVAIAAYAFVILIFLP
jgi:hypothetical protein